MPYLNLQTLITDITDLTNTHAQVQTVHFGGDITDVSQPKNGVPPTYPYVFYMVDSANFTNRQYKVNITGIFMTKCDESEYEMTKAWSDMTEIARDIFAHYSIVAGDGSSWAIDRNAEISVVPFVERFQDTVFGVTVNFPFDIDQANSKCYFPTKP